MFQEYNQSVKQFGFSQARRFVGPDIGPNCLQKLSIDGIAGNDLIDMHSPFSQGQALHSKPDVKIVL